MLIPTWPQAVDGAPKSETEAPHSGNEISI